MADAEMGAIPFTQFLLPNGREESVRIDRPGPIAAKAQAIIAAGYRFECEMLGDFRTVSLTITDPDDGDIEIEVVENGPAVPAAVDALIERFDLTRTRSGG